MQSIEILSTIEDINYKLSGKFSDKNPEYILIYQTNGFSDLVSFNDFVLWCSENDEREFIESKNDYEDFYLFLVRKIKEHINISTDFLEQITEGSDYENEKVKKYVLGFLFSEDQNRVALIMKNGPSWQKGLLNGIGGKVEKGETSLEAMIREFEEEAGVKINNWTYFSELINSEWHVDCFFAFNDLIDNVKTMEQEIVKVYSLEELKNAPIIDNLNFLIPLALNGDIEKSKFYY